MSRRREAIVVVEREERGDDPDNNGNSDDGSEFNDSDSGNDSNDDDKDRNKRRRQRQRVRLSTLSQLDHMGMSLKSHTENLTATWINKIKCTTRHCDSAYTATTKDLPFRVHSSPPHPSPIVFSISSLL